MPKRNQVNTGPPKTAGKGAAENEVWLNAPRFLGAALINWRLSRLPQSEHSPSNQELALAHGCAHELCQLALDAISKFDEPRATNSWREMFCFFVGTLAMYGTKETLALIKQLEKRVPPQEVSMKFRIYQALMWFDEERAASIEKNAALKATGRSPYRSGPPSSGLSSNTTHFLKGLS